ncbi:ABC transporter family substrate-binding protein [Pseudonocardia abyssalis]|uniref:ABC transporter family substrate-binding protein n=2 Tax=Pseudonocardia abyssalis TaxID=2792008 RepID=A0ABS6UW32_9PSEU|nr:ABC transporter family substrate-binding protein [Pseudonocardia abyssalis]MBW0136465.1 ABC transporter family substrate-binding protein [Pseudonocardia abyssalis]
MRAVVLALLTVLLAACTQVPLAEPPPVAPEPTAQPEPSELVVGVEDLGAGFNPHLLAHSSSLTTAVAALVLPSVFRPGPDGVPQLDRTIATSAEVVSTEPFTVSYELNLEASWSTNTPIAAEDFVYLWEQMRADAGVADAAGYRLITDVRSRAGGKAVDVVFDEPYPAWQGLFSDLLPAHLLKDAPGSWIGATTGGLPASGGPFRIATVDAGRGEVVLARNDTYWDTPAVLDTLVLRRLDDAAMATGLAAGDVDVALSEADPAIRTALGGLSPVPRTQLAPLPTVTQLGLRSVDGPLRDARARQGLAALLDREAIRLSVAPEALPADAFGLAPSEPGYAASAPDGAPARPDPIAAEQLLRSAGWARDASGNWTVDGQPVALVIGSAAERPEDGRVARLVAAQLTVAGIDTTAVESPAAELFVQGSAPATEITATTAPATTSSAAPATSSAAPTTAPPPGGGVAVDVIVGPRTVGGAPGTELASDYGCALPTAVVPDPPSTPTGFCFPALQLLLESLAAGSGEDDPARFATAERVLWMQLPALPLFQPVGLVVSSAAADAATGIAPGPLTEGPLAGAARWNEPAR